MTNQLNFSTTLKVKHYIESADTAAIDKIESSSSGNDEANIKYFGTGPRNHQVTAGSTIIESLFQSYLTPTSEVAVTGLAGYKNKVALKNQFRLMFPDYGMQVEVDEAVPPQPIEFEEASKGTIGAGVINDKENDGKQQISQDAAALAPATTEGSMLDLSKGTIVAGSPVPPAVVDLVCDVQESFIYTEKNNNVEKCEIVGTVSALLKGATSTALAASASSNMAKSEGAFPSASVSAAAAARGGTVKCTLDFTDAKVIIKSFDINKKLKFNAVPLAGEKYQKVTVQWEDPALRTFFTASPRTTTTTTTTSTFVPAAAAAATPLLRYTVSQEIFKPMVLKARSVCTRKKMMMKKKSGQATSDSKISIIEDEMEEEVEEVVGLIVQANLNPRFQQTIKGFTMQASIAGIITAMSAEVKGAGKGTGTGKGVGTTRAVSKVVFLSPRESKDVSYNAATKMLSWVCGDMNASNNHSRVTVEVDIHFTTAAAAAALKQQPTAAAAAAKEENGAKLEATVPIMIKGIYEGALLSPVDVDALAAADGTDDDQLFAQDNISVNRTTKLEFRFL